MNEKRRACLWNATAAREREIPEEEIPGDERAESRDEHSSPAGAARRIHQGGKATGQQNECDDDEPDERADDEAE